MYIVSSFCLLSYIKFVTKDSRTYSSFISSNLSTVSKSLHLNLHLSPHLHPQEYLNQLYSRYKPWKPAGGLLALGNKPPLNISHVRLLWVLLHYGLRLRSTVSSRQLVLTRPQFEALCPPKSGPYCTRILTLQRQRSRFLHPGQPSLRP